MKRTFPMARILVLLAALLAVSAECAAQKPQRFPFSRTENSDGAKFVWFVYNLSGFSFPYQPAKSIPASNRFLKLSAGHPQEGDLAWWPRFVGIYDGDSTRSVMTAEGKTPLAALVKKYGPVQWYTYVHGVPVSFELPIDEGRIAYTIPDSTLWKQKDQKYNPTANKGMLLFERDSVIDADGNASQPIMSIVYEQLLPGMTNVGEFARGAARPDVMKVTSIDTVEQSVLYHCAYNDSVDHTVLILYSVEETTGLTVLCDATAGTFEALRREFLAFLESVHFRADTGQNK